MCMQTEINTKSHTISNNVCTEREPRFIHNLHYKAKTARNIICNQQKCTNCYHNNVNATNSNKTMHDSVVVIYCCL